MRILHLEAYNYSESSLGKLKRIGELDIVNIQDQKQLNQLLSKEKYDCIFTTIGYYLGKDNLTNQKQLKTIVTPTTGLNHIDLEYAEKSGIRIVSLKGESDFLKEVQSTAEHTWALLLGVVRNLPAAIKQTQNGNWNRFSLLCDELNTKTIGIIGFGRLGRIVAEYAKAFNMKILIHDNNIKIVEEALGNKIKAVELDKLLSESDIVVLLASYSEKNENMIGHHEFELMKKDAYFINTSRGELVDEAALLDALESNKLKGAALDVLRNDSSWKNEIPGNHPLQQFALQNEKLIITPHIGGYGKVSIEKTRDFITDKYLNTLN